MEQDSIFNLIELLKSQLALYTEVKNILAAEKEAVIGWHVEDTSKFNNDKKRLMRKERILEEARLTLSLRIQNELGLDDGTLSSIILACPDEVKAAKLADLREQLLEIAYAINEESVSLKILYSTNLKLINEMYAQMGYLPTNKYGAEPMSGLPGTISTLG